MSQIVIGQRWISEMEKELGLGIVTEVNEKNIRLQFPASNCERLYSISSAPLQRVQFKEHDTITSRNGKSFKITAITNENGLLIYHGNNCSIYEIEIGDSISFTTAKSRLISANFDENRKFNIRFQALKFQYEISKSPVRGFIGGRVDLIPHQFYIAHEVASRHLPRVLLSDEVGLGKTIESCLILHRLLITGRISRVLIIVPQSLVHQWFVELIRKFNLIFRIFDEDYCQTIISLEPETNPFLEDQLAICSMDFLTSREIWSQHAINAQWNMVVVDEAHHLTEQSSAYNLIKNLSAASHGLMLLTATPMQLGQRNHFACLQLLDPDRYCDFNKFKKEIEDYQVIAKYATSLMNSEQINFEELRKFGFFSLSMLKELKYGLGQSLQIDNEIKNQIVEKIIDYYGTGRAVFRNSRSVISGFPQRIVQLIPLPCSADYLQNLKDEFEHDLESNDENFQFEYQNDPRIKWMIDFLKLHKNEKMLIICRSISKVKAIEETLRNHLKIQMSVFHEELSLLQRDRNAAYFANSDGAQIMICSEIGSEGRNFQFTHHLILLDLPVNPELLEQRIGRLDRIGQKNDIFIHVPFVKDSEYEILAMLYHHGLKAFEINVPGISEINRQLANKIKEIAFNKQFSKLDNLISQTKRKCAKVKKQLAIGRDLLLELNSFRPKFIEHLISKIVWQDNDRHLEKFMLKVFDIFGIRFDNSDFRTYHLNLELLKTPEFPLPVHHEQILQVTFDRKKAMSREDIEFLNMDHPMVTGAIDLILGSEIGNCAVAQWKDTADQKMVLEAIYVLECVADKVLHADRFLPPTPIYVAVNQKGEEISAVYSEGKMNKFIKETTHWELLKSPQFRNKLLPILLQQSEIFATVTSEKIKSEADKKMKEILMKEKLRLIELKKVNANIRREEISNYKKQIEQLGKIIQSARLRIDSVRLIVPEN